MKHLLLTLNLQFFAEPQPTDPQPTEPQPTDPQPQGEPEKTFTQAELDQIIADRLAREKAKAQKELDEQKAEAERKRLEEQNEYKTLYEQTQQQLAQAEAEKAAAQLAARKKELIIEAGYKPEQLADISALVTGSDEAEIVESFERIKKLIPVAPQHVDPTLHGSQRQGAPKTKDNYEAARERARSLLKRKK